MTALGLACQTDANAVGEALAREMESETPSAPPDLMVPKEFQDSEQHPEAPWRQRQALEPGYGTVGFEWP